MPRLPDLAPIAHSIAGSLYSAARRKGPAAPIRFPLHIGDTWREPADGCRMQDLDVERFPGMHRYARVQGDRRLLQAVAARVEARTGRATRPENVLITAGATGGLATIVSTLLAPHEEVLVAAPFWPLIRGIVLAFQGVPVPVPSIGAVDGAAACVESFAARLGPKTAAIYLSTPNNPSGRVLPRSWLEALVEFARRHGLWILSDEVYEEHRYVGEHASVRSLETERAVCAHSFSKSYGMAGNRCGYLVGPEEVIAGACKLGTHLFYHAPLASQLAAVRALDGRGDAWAAEVRAENAETGRRCAEILGVPPPQGSTFLWLDVARHLDETGLPGFLARCAERGLLVAPGPSFGPYPTHIRVCYTCVPPQTAIDGVSLLAEMVTGSCR